MTSSALERQIEALAAVVRRFPDFAASEDAAQKALIAAAERWPRDGIPENPLAWLVRVALRRLTDHVRSEIARRNREAIASEETATEFAPSPNEEMESASDDTLVLLFMCCHPALSSASAMRSPSGRSAA